MICYKIQQNTPEWYALRLGRATASNFPKIMAHEGKAFGDPAKEYAERIAIESITGVSVESYTNEWMERGHELEPIARRLYEERFLTQVSDGGFFASDCGRFGGSPDGLCETGGIEIKSVKWNTQMSTLKGASNKYLWQIVGNIWLGELEYIDYVSYCPEMPESKQLFVQRIERDEELIKRLTTRLNDFWELVELNKNLLNNE